MPDHYWTQTPSSEGQRQTIEIHVRGIRLALTTDRGVFSKEHLDFGSRVLISTVELPKHGHIVDLGCGYGPVASVLGRVYPDTAWTLVDVNERALELARENTNSICDRVQVVSSDGFANLPELVADAILLNPPIRAGKQVVYRLFEESHAHLTPGGTLWVVIQKKQGAPSAKAKLEELFPDVQTVAREGGYHVFRCCRKSFDT